MRGDAAFGCFGTGGRVFDDDRGIAGAVPDVCGRRAACPWLQYMEYGVLRLFHRRHGYLETDDEKRDIQTENYGGIRIGLHGYAAVGGIFGHAGNTGFGNHGASFWRICGGDAAHPFGNRFGGRADYGGRAGIYP